MEKMEYQELITGWRELRAKSLSSISHLTLAPIDNDLLLLNAQTAYDAYAAIKSLKMEMNKEHPHICACSCGKSTTENEEA
jgi:hypothetical protein